MQPVETEEEPAEHAPGRFEVPTGYEVLTGSSDGERRSVAVVVAKFNGEITSRLLERALDTLEEEGVARNAVTVMPVPGAFELPLAAIETGVPVSFGVLTTETTEQAEARIDRAADAVRSGLEMADVFQQLRAAAR